MCQTTWFASASFHPPAMGYHKSHRNPVDWFSANRASCSRPLKEPCLPCLSYHAIRFSVFCSRCCSSQDSRSGSSDQWTWVLNRNRPPGSRFRSPKSGEPRLLLRWETISVSAGIVAWSTFRPTGKEKLCSSTWNRSMMPARFISTELKLPRWVSFRPSTAVPWEATSVTQSNRNWCCPGRPTCWPSASTSTWEELASTWPHHCW